MNIIITGASRGIGFETAKLLSAEHNVIAISRSIDRRDFKSRPNIIPIAFDFENGNIKKELLLSIKKHFNKVDILINNAAIFIKKQFEEITQEDFEKIFRINFFSIAELTQAILPLMNRDGRDLSAERRPPSLYAEKSQSTPHVLNIVSMGGIQGSTKFHGLSAYSSSKGALITLTECLAEEYKSPDDIGTGKNVSFNAIAFGAVQTEMLKEAFPNFKAPMSAAQAAEFVSYFALNGHHYFNGKILQMALSTP